ncbi:hypothetical protein [Paraburkholderia lycopersici]|uniref:hypothetical protein n=1 Tax=Paraburkholderia lycopersici TaxID=416944 RepID=UPI001FE1E969|nr:hypothetical protein [Paraburkholderia lycopersici]
METAERCESRQELLRLCARGTRHDPRTAMETSVVATGPPVLCAMFNAVFAAGSRAFGIAAYAAEIEGMLMVP